MLQQFNMDVTMLVTDVKTIFALLSKYFNILEQNRQYLHLPSFTNNLNFSKNTLHLHNHLAAKCLESNFTYSYSERGSGKILVNLYLPFSMLKKRYWDIIIDLWSSQEVIFVFERKTIAIFFTYVQIKINGANIYIRYIINILIHVF